MSEQQDRSALEEFAQQIADAVESFLRRAAGALRRGEPRDRRTPAAGGGQPDPLRRCPAGRPARLRRRRSSTSLTSGPNPMSTPCGSGWPGCSTAWTPTPTTSTPTLPRSLAGAALRRPDQHRHRPRQRAAPLPVRRRRPRRCGGGSSPTSPPGETTRARCCGRCSPWWRTTVSTPTSRARATRSLRPRSVLDGGVGDLSSPRRIVGGHQPAPQAGAPTSSEERVRGHRGAEVRRLLPRRRLGRQAGGPPHRGGQARRQRRRGRRLGDGRQHRRAARAGRGRQPAAARRASWTCC